ncbi:hypothetical protein HNR19_004362 [Nocardioides thalensis]|uniref:Integral membrane protein n=1 Tax=Nocardioides thalensis TaxID=1914755 RepID=A0A853C7W7_9ACTN|nr:hypothetical protein [Nocardioides thalensis]NYJ03664.1 hypothetical protein [Nocardioides thalensis]
MTATQLDHTATTARRRWFGLDALVTGANGLAYLVAAGPLTDLLGGDATTFRWIGAFLLAYAVAVGAYAAAPRSAAVGWVIVGANAVWVVASLEVAVTGALDLDAVGRGWAAAQALVVGALAAIQASVLRARR